MHLKNFHNHQLFFYRVHLLDVNNYITYSDTTSLSKNCCYPDIAVLQNFYLNVLIRFSILKVDSIILKVDSTYLTFFNQPCNHRMLDSHKDCCHLL